MPHPLSDLMWLVAFQLVLNALAWVLAGHLLREERRALWHWAAFNTLLALSLLLLGLRGSERSWWAFNGANVLTLLGFALMRRGSEQFSASGRSDLSQALLVAPWLLLLLLIPPTLEWASARTCVAYFGQAVVLFAQLQSCAPALRREFGRRTHHALLVPMAIIAAVNATQGLRQLWNWSQPLELHRDLGMNYALLYSYLAGTAIFGFGFLVVVVKRLTVRLREASQRDELTGLLNRRAMNEFLDGQWHRHLRRRYPLALVMVDLDHFKRINDSQGHAAGDAVLRRTAELFRQHLRREDLVGRMGGEEFLLLLPDTTEDAAFALAERLRHQAEVEGLGVTLSMGLTMARADDADAAVAVQRADAALYRAKAGGRNRAERA